MDEEERRMAQVRALQMSFYGESAMVEVECNENDNDSQEQEQEEECTVNYYEGVTEETATAAAASFPTFDAISGKISNLPLWRAPWQEVLGRSNVLNVHDPIYTSMFESILYGNANSNSNSNSNQQPLYFGHLYLEGGSENLSPSKSKDPKFQLQTWRGETLLNNDNKSDNQSGDDGDESNESQSPQKPKRRPPPITTATTSTNPHHSSAVIGCLLQIQDYRRMSDGRLLLLVHAVERFVISKVTQDLPYSIANVQLLPDVEELTSKALQEECAINESMTLPSSCSSLDTVVDLSENEVAQARAQAIQESMMKYHNYEYDAKHHLQLPNGPKVGVKHISYDAMTKVLPYAPYSRDGFVEQGTTTLIAANDQDTTETPTPTAQQNEAQDASLECELLRRGIFKIPPTDPEFADRLRRQLHGNDKNNDETGNEIGSDEFAMPPEITVDELEQQLWIAINDFYVTKQKLISPLLLSLLPPSSSSFPNEWPEDFVLHKIAEGIQSQRAKRKRKNGGVDNKEFIDITDISSKVRIGSIHEYQPLHADYPSYRRQRRLSYTAAYLLETGDEPEKTQRFRALLLSIPSTGQRLKLVLERFYQWQAQNAEDLGVFE